MTYYWRKNTPVPHTLLHPTVYAMGIYYVLKSNQERKLPTYRFVLSERTRFLNVSVTTMCSSRRMDGQENIPLNAKEFLDAGDENY